MGQSGIYQTCDTGACMTVIRENYTTRHSKVRAAVFRKFSHTRHSKDRNRHSGIHHARHSGAVKQDPESTTPVIPGLRSRTRNPVNLCYIT